MSKLDDAERWELELLREREKKDRAEVRRLRASMRCADRQIQCGWHDSAINTLRAALRRRPR